MTIQSGKLVCGAALLAWLVGCTTATSEQAGPVPEVEDRAGADAASVAGTDSDSEAGAAGTTGTLADSGAIEGSPLADLEDAELTLVIYFEFDSSEIHPDDRIVVEAHAQYLARAPETEVVLEGHADERGSREYNVALGEGRANGVRDLLRLLGVGDHQIRTVSYGEERPAVIGHEEESWSRNRRVEFAYVAR